MESEQTHGGSGYTPYFFMQNLNKDMCIILNDASNPITTRVAESSVKLDIALK